MSWEEHVARGHWPPHRGCWQCARGQATFPPHRRVKVPQGFALSVDLVGPYKKAKDELSERRRFCLIASYVLPVDASGAPLLTQTQLDSVKETGYLTPELEEE